MTTQTIARERGRPKTSDYGVASAESKLFQFLQSKLPHYTIRNRLNVRLLAADIEYRPQSVYKMFSRDRIAVEAARKVVAVSKGKLRLEDLLPFLTSK